MASGMRYSPMPENHLPNSPPFTAKEWPIIYYSQGTGPFSAERDSGAVVFDARRRMSEMITADAGIPARTDITYVTPMKILLANIQSYNKKSVNLDVETK